MSTAMAVDSAFDTSPARLLRSMRGTVIDARLAYPEILHLEIRDRAGRIWLFATQDAQWSPADPSQFAGRELRDVELDERTGALRIPFSGGVTLEVSPGDVTDVVADDPPAWELIAPNGVLLAVGPGERWWLSRGNSPH